MCMYGNANSFEVEVAEGLIPRHLSSVLILRKTHKRARYATVLTNERFLREGVQKHFEDAPSPRISEARGSCPVHGKTRQVVRSPVAVEEGLQMDRFLHWGEAFHHRKDAVKYRCYLVTN